MDGPCWSGEGDRWSSRGGEVLHEPGNTHQTRSAKTSRGATRAFTSLDFITAKKHAGMIDWAARPWDGEEYRGISKLGMKLYRGVIVSKAKYPGKEDRRKARLGNLLATQDVQAPATAAVDANSGSAMQDVQAPATAAVDADSSSEAQDDQAPVTAQLTAENLAALDANLGSATQDVQAPATAAVDANSGSAASHVHPTESVSSLSDLSSAASDVDLTPSGGQDTPHELVPAASESAPEQLVGTSSSSQSRTVPPTPVSLQRPLSHLTY